jgi:hypothetical protein
VKNNVLSTRMKYVNSSISLKDWHISFYINHNYLICTLEIRENIPYIF